MVSRSDDADGLGVRPAVVLRPAKKVERAHGHGQVGVFGEALNQAVENGTFDVSVDFYPAGGCEYALHRVLGAQDEEIDHIARIALFVGNATRDFREKILVYAGQRVDLPGDHARGTTFGDIHLNAHHVVAVSGVIGGLIDAHVKPPRHGCDNIAARAYWERLSVGLIAYAPDERATSRCIQGHHT